MLIYEFYKTGAIEPFATEESSYQYQVNETLFFWQGKIKKAYSISSITHDNYLESGKMTVSRHVIRVYCQEKRTY